MQMIIEILIVICLVTGGLFGLIGSYGLLKLRDPMARLHAPTKASTLGVGAVLLASVLHAWVFEEAASFHEILIMVFLFLTAPISAHFIAKAHLHWNVKDEDLPVAGTDRGWAYVNDNPEERDLPKTDRSD